MAAPILLSCENLTKAYGERPLFDGLTFTLHEGDRVGLVGPNGAGKSTLLKILASLETPDSGECKRRRGLRVGYVPQTPEFPPGMTAREMIDGALGDDVAGGDRLRLVAQTLSRFGFPDPEASTDTLSGGWRARLAIAQAWVREPDLLLLDEPTNHLDLESILWLESRLTGVGPSFVVVSHDRVFLQKATNRMIEIDRVYPEGLLSVNGPYADLLEAREELLSHQAAHAASLANHVRREVAWLRRGAKARTSKSKARIQAAERSMDELGESRSRAGVSRAGIELTASGRKTKRLWACEKLTKRFGDNTVIDSFELLLTPGTRLGVLGPNGTGKTTLLRLIVGEIEPDAGTIRPADGLRVVYFDQNRQSLDPDATLKRALAPDGDSVIFQERSVHVVTWAKRFMFRPAQLDQPVSRLSGGERARVILARVMLEPADLLILDEPTNDLDIPTLDVLEEALLDFAGALVLVSHDRHLVDRVTTGILALDGDGSVTPYADYRQWEDHRRKAQEGKKSREPRGGSSASRPKAKKLTYMEQREWDGMEATVLAAESLAEAARARAGDPSVATDASELSRRMTVLDEAQGEVDRLYARWAELEEKIAAGAEKSR